MSVHHAPANVAGGHERREPISIQSASSWVLRVGVILSMAVMFTGLLLALVRGGVTVQEMETRPFVTNFGAIGHGVRSADPFALMELGVVLLVLTPIMRVFTAMVLFAVEEHDRLYAGVTFLVLVMTLGSLLLVH